MELHLTHVMYVSDAGIDRVDDESISESAWAELGDVVSLGDKVYVVTKTDEQSIHGVWIHFVICEEISGVVEDDRMSDPEGIVSVPA